MTEPAGFKICTPSEIITRNACREVCLEPGQCLPFTLRQVAHWITKAGCLGTLAASNRPTLEPYCGDIQTVVARSRSSTGVCVESHTRELQARHSVMLLLGGIGAKIYGCLSCCLYHRRGRLYITSGEVYQSLVQFVCPLSCSRHNSPSVSFTKALLMGHTPRPLGAVRHRTRIAIAS